MAWFRAGGGGIPSAIKTDMNAVLNKKFGTSTDYPPTDWATSVNLLGPLPEKTASGTIAHIEDGADTVPLKSWDVTVDANLDGVSSIKVTQAGKNLADFSTFVDGYVNTNGTFNTNHPNGEMRSDFIPVKPNTQYYFSIIDTTGTAADWVGIGEYTTNSTSGFIRRDSFWRFTTSPTTKYIVISSRNLAQASAIQLEVSYDPTSYEPYTAPTVTTVSIGRTIYGGTADVVNGTGTDENGNDFTFDPMTPIPETALGVNNFWADEGDSEVTYRADISLLLNSLQNNRGLMMMRPVNTEEIEFEEEENNDESNR